MELRDLPSVDELAREAGDPLAVEAARAVIDRAREEIQTGTDPGDLAARLREELADARRPRLRRVLNATGVVVHTNLGRAPLAEEAVERVAAAARGYSNLEYDLSEGARGSRQDHVAAVLRRLTGAEAALVVNNNAAAVLLALAALAEGRDVVVSRGELIEIGDGFRIPDVLARSGARLVEIGTTNRTRAADYERAIGPETAVVLRVHQSNFRVVGFEERPRLEEVAAVARRHGLPLVDDLGSGAIAPVEAEPTARESLAAGADLVCFSGDKLLGGPQAGIVLGRAELVERLRRHPLQRALRIDKLSLAALEGTLLLHLEAPERIPVLRTLAQGSNAVRERAERLAAATGGEVEETVGRVGGGALPLAELPSFACALEESLAAPLRAGEPPVVGVVRDGRLLLDCLTLTDEEADETAKPRRRRPRMTELWDFLRGALMSKALAAVVDAGVPEALANGPRPVSELQGDPDTLHRLLRALASDGVFRETEPGVFEHTEQSRQPARPRLERVRASLRRRLLRGDDGSRRVDGRGAVPWPLRNRLLGVARGASRRARDVRRRDGGGASSSRGAARGPRVARGRSGRRRRRRQRRTARRVDPAPPRAARHRPRPARDGARRGWRSATASSSWPAASSSRCRRATPISSPGSSTTGPTRTRRRILRTIRAAAPQHARLLINESVIRPGNDADGAKWLDLLMLVLAGGRERDEAQWRELFSSTGWEAGAVPRGRPDRGAAGLVRCP